MLTQCAAEQPGSSIFKNDELARACEEHLRRRGVRIVFVWRVRLKLIPPRRLGRAAAVWASPIMGYATPLVCRLPSPSGTPPRPASRERAPPPPTRRGDPRRQALRFGVILRKVWGGSRTWAVARAQSVLMSVWRTCWQRGHNGLDFLSQLLRREPAIVGLPP